MSLCASYTDSRLAAVYDALNPPGRDAAFYLELAGTSPKHILDVGCGTGRLACDLAANGHWVTGVDPAAAMLDIGRKRLGGDKVRWIETDAAGLSVDTKFDLAIMTGHVFQVFQSDEDARAALRAINRHRSAHGHVAFETRNPLVREWEDWRPESTRERVEVEGLGAVDVHYDISSASGQLVTFETHFRFANDGVITRSTLRFISQEEVAMVLADAGFTEIVWYGDWDKSPVQPSSPEIIVVAR